MTLYSLGSGNDMLQLVHTTCRALFVLVAPKFYTCLDLGQLCGIMEVERIVFRQMSRTTCSFCQCLNKMLIY
jgi:hypothetical protein